MPNPSVATNSTTASARDEAPVLQLRGASEAVRHGPLTAVPIMTSGDSVFGAEVSGIDWASPVPPEIVQQVGHSQSALPTSFTALTVLKRSLCLCKINMP